MKKIYIVILHYNGFTDTAKCLPTLHLLKAHGYSITILIVDNASRESDRVALQNLVKKLKLKNTKLIQNKKNLGFAKGNNVGIRYALDQGADHVLLLNNDTQIKMNFLPRLLAINAPISSPVVVFREYKEHPKLLYDLGGYVNFWTGRTTHQNVYEKEYQELKKGAPFEVDYVAGCCMLVKKEVFDNIGLLDEKYFIYFEDVDFCVTAIKNNMKVVVDPGTIIYHKLGGSMDRWSNRAIFHNLFGNFIFITKHLGWKRIIGYAYLFILSSKIILDRIRNT